MSSIEAATLSRLDRVEKNERVAFNRESGAVSHTAYFAPGVSLKKVVTAARLRADKGNCHRQVPLEKGVSGALTASMQNGAPVLQCSIDYEQNMD